MKSKLRFIFLGIGMIALVAFLLASRKNIASQNTSTGNTTQAEAERESIDSSQTVFYPVPRYNERLTVRPYATDVKPDDHDALPCGDQFQGFHTADDTEVFSEELQTEVPVFAIADGVVRQVADVNGYGGLVVIEHVLNGQTMTVYHGHIDLSQTKLRVNDRVKA